MWEGFPKKFSQPIKEREVFESLKRVAGALNTNIVLFDEKLKEVKMIEYAIRKLKYFGVIKKILAFHLFKSMQSE